MRVGTLRDWLKYLTRGDSTPLRVRQVDGLVDSTHDVFATSWRVQSQTVAGMEYTVAYIVNVHGEYVACDCMAGRRGQRCKHAAMVLATIHGAEFRSLIRKGPR